MILTISLLLTILFAIASWKRYGLGVALFFTLLPTYLIRFSIGPYPTTLLELLLVVLVLIGLYKYKLQIQLPKLVTIGTLFFLIGATIGVLTAIDLRPALGEWKAFYISPILLASTLFLASKQNKQIYNSILLGITVSATGVILFTLWQVATGGTFVPPGFVQPDGSFRATGWYGFPNGVGILLGLSFFPAIAYLRKIPKSIVTIPLFVLASLTTMLFAKSTGALIAIAAGTGVLLLIYKKKRMVTMIAGVVGAIVFLLLPMDNPVKQELLLQDRSGQIRTHMWAEAWELLKDRPFVGAGMASYEERIVPYHTTVNGEGIEIFHHPHNIFLTIWVNTGLIGLMGFILLLVSTTNHAVRTQEWYLLAFLTACIVMGLVDSPYIKNDWSVLFWAGVALIHTRV